MCAILDVNSIGKFKDPTNEDMKPVWHWLENKKGEIVYSDTDKFRREWERGGGHTLMRELQRRDKFRLVKIQDVQQKENELIGKIASDDPHIIALAIVADVKVLISSDQALHRDFKNRNLVGGKVYQNKKHARLLTKDTCP